MYFMCLREYVNKQFQAEEIQEATGSELHDQTFVRFFNINNFKLLAYQKQLSF